MINRVNDAVLETFFDILSVRLLEAYDGRTWREICMWLRGAMVGNQHLFIYNEGAIGCFALSSVRQRRSPDVEEIFCLGKSMPKDKDDVIALYRQAYAWGQNNRCNAFYIDNCTDLKKEDFKAFLPKIGQEILPFARILRDEPLP
jgi:hypothetical protein